MSTKDILIATRELLSDESRWTKNSGGRTAEGAACSASNADAVAFCLAGAACRVSPEAGLDAISMAVMKHRSALSITSWNDHPFRTHADVLAFLDEAIEAAS